MNVPTDKELVTKMGIDSSNVLKNFLGKSIEGTIEMIRFSMPFYAEDLSSMGPIAFNYYFKAFKALIIDQSYKSDGDVIFLLPLPILMQLEQHNELVKESQKDIAEVAAYVLSNWSNYDDYADDKGILNRWIKIQKLVT